MSNLSAFMMGTLLGSALTGSIVGAGTFYDSKGNVRAPAGSQQSFDYYRQRQMFIDMGHLRANSDKERLGKQLHPCAK